MMDRSERRSVILGLVFGLVFGLFCAVVQQQTLAGAWDARNVCVCEGRGVCVEWRVYAQPWLLRQDTKPRVSATLNLQ